MQAVAKERTRRRSKKKKTRQTHLRGTVLRRPLGPRELSPTVLARAAGGAHAAVGIAAAACSARAAQLHAIRGVMRVCAGNGGVNVVAGMGLCVRVERVGLRRCAGCLRLSGEEVLAQTCGGVRW